ncbi:hypothetical protein EDC04DRAFT_2910356 [Pisolithus marmoratus]|nr:hypothetical protein EDC04DRAFT_2910356 [Pisolithus marmoratus]
MFDFVHHHPGPPNLLFQPFNTPLPLHTFLYHILSLFLEAFNMVRQLHKQKVITSSDDEESTFPLPSQKQASNLIVNSVLCTMLSQPSSSSSYPYLPSNTQPSTSAKTSFHQAHAKSNKGLKGKSKSGSYKHCFKREGQSEKGLCGHPKTLDFQVAHIIFLPYGVHMPSPDIDSDSTLTSAQLSRLEAAGLAHSNFCSYFDFNQEWTWPQVDDMLCGKFPQLFKVLDTHTKVANANYNTRGMVVTHDEIPLKLIAQWIKKQHLKGKGKHRAETDSSAEDTESQPVWPKSDSGDNIDDPILSPISHSLKRHCIDAHDSDSEQAGPLHTGLLQHETIDLTDGLMDDVTSDGPEDPSLLPDAQALTLPSTPTQTTTLPAPSSSFMIDTSLANPWKGNHTFQF